MFFNGVKSGAVKETNRVIKQQNNNNYKCEAIVLFYSMTYNLFSVLIGVIGVIIDIPVHEIRFQNIIPPRNNEIVALSNRMLTQLYVNSPVPLDTTGSPLVDGTLHHDA